MRRGAGLAVPEGHTVYVLVRDEQTWTFWSADGHRFAATDQFIPLQKVFTVFSPDNVRLFTVHTTSHHIFTYCRFI